MKVRTSDCSAGEGEEGYRAAMEWRRVHEARPRERESGGQSSVSEASLGVDLDADADERAEFLMEVKLERSLHVRHLVGSRGLARCSHLYPEEAFGIVCFHQSREWSEEEAGEWD